VSWPIVRVPAVVAVLVLATACATAPPPAPEVKVNNRLYVANESSNAVSVIDASALTPLRTIPLDRKGAHDMALTRDGRTLFVSNLLSGAVAVIDTATFEVTATIVTGNRCHSLALTNDEKQLWVVNIGENNISIIDVPRLRVLGTIADVAKLPGHVRLSRDGRFAYVTSQEDGRVNVIETATFKVVKSIEVGRLPHFIIVSPDGRYLWGGNTGGTEVYVIDMTTNERVATIPVGPKPQHIGFGVRGMFGPFAYVAVEDADEVVVIDAKPGAYKIVDRIKVSSKPSGIGASPEGGRIYVSTQGNDQLQVIDTGTHRVIGHVPVGIKPVGVVATQ
jgi:YVTN family beta-propeller protein